MTKILHIDTSNEFCSVALSHNDKLIGLRETNEKDAHARVVALFTEEILKENNLNPSDLDALAVSEGPGSYTGLRIGVSAAKGFCYALNKPLIAVGTLKSMANGIIEKYSLERKIESDMIFCPMIDARRMEVYAALFDVNGNEIRETKAEIIDENSFQELLNKHQIIFSGNGAKKCKPLLCQNKNAIFQADFTPSAKFMIPTAMEKFKRKQFEDVAYFEPFYLKSFVAGLPRVKGLR